MPVPFLASSSTSFLCAQRHVPAAAVAIHHDGAGAVENLFVLGPAVVDHFDLQVGHGLLEQPGQKVAAGVVLVGAVTVAGIAGNEDDLLFGVGGRSRGRGGAAGNDGQQGQQDVLIEFHPQDLRSGGKEGAGGMPGGCCTPGGAIQTWGESIARRQAGFSAGLQHSFTVAARRATVNFPLMQGAGRFDRGLVHFSAAGHATPRGAGRKHGPDPLAWRRVSSREPNRPTARMQHGFDLPANGPCRPGASNSPARPDRLESKA